MKTGKFFSVLVMFLSLLVAAGEVYAMPQASDLLAFYYTLFEHNREDFVNEAVYRNGTEEAEKAVEDFKQRTNYSQEQAVKEIGQMIENGDLPNYILSKGTYKYDGNINTVYCIADTNLLSQPDKDARVVLDLHMGIFSPAIAFGRCSYFGEWTSPQGEHWVIVNFPSQIEEYDEEEDIEKTAEALKETHEEEKILTGFIYGKDISFVTNGQLQEAVKAIEVAVIMARDAASEQKSMEERFAKELQQVRQQAQRQVQQVQQTGQQQQTQYQIPKHQVYYCRRCGKKQNRLDGPPPGFGCYPHGARKPGVHDWARLD